MSLGERIRRAREDAGLTAFDLAIQLRRIDPELDRTNDKRVSEWENDKVERLAFRVVAAIAEATGKSLDFFRDVDDADAAALAEPASLAASDRAAERAAREAERAREAAERSERRDAVLPDRRSGSDRRAR